jgi:hypothetical protein
MRQKEKNGVFLPRRECVCCVCALAEGRACGEVNGEGRSFRVENGSDGGWGAHHVFIPTVLRCVRVSVEEGVKGRRKTGDNG